MIRWKAHRGRVYAVSLSRDGRHLASITATGQDVSIWDPLTGQAIRKLRPTGTVSSGTDHTRSLTFAPDCDLLMIGRQQTLEWWDTAEWRCVDQSYLDSSISSATTCAIGPGDAPQCLSSHSGGIIFYSRKEVAGKAGSHWKTNGGFKINPSPDLAFSPDGRELAIHTDQELVVIDTITRKRLRTHSHPKGNYIGPVQFSPDSSRIVYASTKVIESHPAALDDPDGVILFKGHRNKVWVIRHTPDGKMLVSASSDGTVRTWDAATGRELRRFDSELGKVPAGDVSRDGSVAVVGGQTGEIIVWDLDS